MEAAKVATERRAATETVSNHKKPGSRERGACVCKHDTCIHVHVQTSTGLYMHVYVHTYAFMYICTHCRCRYMHKHICDRLRETPRCNLGLRPCARNMPNTPVNELTACLRGVAAVAPGCERA